MRRNVVTLVGRLGNQMFQFAFAEWLRERTGVPTVYDLSVVGKRGLTGPAALRERFWSDRVRGSQTWPVVTGRVDRVGRALRLALGPPRLRVDLTAQGPNEIPLGEAWYLGYWQRADYARVVRGYLRDVFGVREDRDPVVRVHVRRGDYVQLGHSADPDWFGRALEEALTGETHGAVEVVSDDPAWCEDRLRLPVPFTVHPPASPETDFLRLARASILVATGSTFSWWAAFVGGVRVFHSDSVLPDELWRELDAVEVP